MKNSLSFHWADKTIYQYNFCYNRSQQISYKYVKRLFHQMKIIRLVTWVTDSKKKSAEIEISYDTTYPLKRERAVYTISNENIHK